jgi:hypothetical protein
MQASLETRDAQRAEACLDRVSGTANKRKEADAVVSVAAAERV